MSSPPSLLNMTWPWLQAALLVFLFSVSSLSAPVPGAKGYLDVVADCGADPTGQTDSTASLKQCINVAYQYGGPVSQHLWPVPLFFPLGVYTVSDTLTLTQTNTPSTDDGVNVCPARFLGFSVFGSSASTGGKRPTIYLAPSSPGFNTHQGYKPVVHIRNDVNENVDMNNVWRGMDIDLTAAGNPSAVGIQHAGAQGATMSDVSVRALSSTFACFAGLNGAGGEHSNIVCEGGRYGVYADDSQPCPALVGSTLINQSISAIYYSSQESLSLVGSVIVTSPSASGPAITSTGGNRAMSIIDTTIDCMGNDQTAIETPSTLYVRDAYILGCDVAISQSSIAPLPGPSQADQWLHIEEWARGTDTGRYFFTNVVYMDGVRSVNGSVRSTSMLPKGTSPPHDLQSRHVWDSSIQAGVDSPNVANAKTTCGAQGDDVTDDTQALQICLDKYSAVFLPPGRYRISATLNIRAGGSLVGMGSSFSFLLAATNGFPGASHAAPLPMVRTATADASSPPTVIAFIGIFTWQHLADVFTMDWQTHNPLSLWRSNFETRECECLWTSGYQRHTPPDIPCSLPTNLTIPRSLFRGLGRVHQFVNDDTGHIISTGAKYRALRIADTVALASPEMRTRFYSLNLEHAQSEANAEITNSSWVDIYSVKVEGNLPILWIRGNSHNVSLLGLGGGFTAWPMNWTFPPDFTPATPSAFRVDEGARDVTLAMLQDHGYGTDDFWPPTGGDCKWTHYYPFPGEHVPNYPYWSFPNTTMWNCWYGIVVSNVYWVMIWSPPLGVTHPADKPVLWRLRGASARSENRMEFE